MSTITAPSLPAVPPTHSPPAALLREIESLLGYRPADSLVVRIRRRRRSAGVLRVDLPRRPADGPDPLDQSPPPDAPPLDQSPTFDESQHFCLVADIVTGHLSRLSGVVAVDLVAFGDGGAEPSAAGVDVPADLQGVRLAKAIDAVRARLAAAGFEVLGAYCVVGEQRVAAESADAAAQNAVSPAASPLDAHHGGFVPLNAVPAARRARALAALATLQSRAPAAVTEGSVPVVHEPDVVDHLVRWRTVLDWQASMPSEVRAIELAWSLRHKLVRDAVLMQCAWGFEAGLLAVQESFEITPAQRSTGVFATFIGECGRAPTAQRLRRAVDVLRHIVECSPEQITAAPLTMLAWLEWARGRGTASAAYLAEALVVDPDYELAGLFKALVRRGFLPEWIR